MRHLYFIAGQAVQAVEQKATKLLVSLCHLGDQRLGARSPDISERYFGLKESFEALFGRSVDLVMAGAMRNPYFIESANRSRRPVYASALAAAAGARIGHRE